MARLQQGNSEIGETVALLDAMIVLARITTKRIDSDAMICGSRGDKYQPIRDALTELMDSGFRKIIDGRDERAMDIIHQAAELLESRVAETISK